MNFFNEVVDIGRRATVDALSGGGIERDSPFSPDVDEDLRQWLPDLFVSAEGETSGCVSAAQNNLSALHDSSSKRSRAALCSIPLCLRHSLQLKLLPLANRLNVFILTFWQDRFPVVFPWSKPQPVDPALHTVWIWDNTAFRRSSTQGGKGTGLDKVKDASASEATVIDQNGTKQPAREASGWETEFVASYFLKNSGKDEARVVARIAKLLNVGDEDVTTHKRIARRLQPFLDTVLPNRTLRINIDGREEQTIGPSNLSGISQDIHQLHFEPSAPGLLQSDAENLPPPFSISGTTVVADERGWGIISDIVSKVRMKTSGSVSKRDYFF